LEFYIKTDYGPVCAFCNCHSAYSSAERLRKTIRNKLGLINVTPATFKTKQKENANMAAARIFNLFLSALLNVFQMKF
jgi:hypothetical protein